MERFTYRGSVTGIAGLPDNEKDVGGYESYPTVLRESTWDSDRDGLPDWWETQRGWNPKSLAGDYGDTNADRDGDGFTEMDRLSPVDGRAPLHRQTEHVDRRQSWRDVPWVYEQRELGVEHPGRRGRRRRPNGDPARPTRCGFARRRVVADSAGSQSSKDIVAFVTDGSAACP